MFLKNKATAPLLISKGNFIKISSTVTGVFEPFTSGPVSDHVGTILEQNGSSTTDTYRNYLCAVQTVELQ